MIRDFDDLEVWHKANEFLMKIYDICEGFPKEEKYLLKRQLIDSASSIGANIAEGFGRYHYQENIQFLRIARGSAAESKNHIIVARNRAYITTQEFESLVEDSRIIRVMLNKLIKATQKQLSKDKGS